LKPFNFDAHFSRILDRADTPPRIRDRAIKSLSQNPIDQAAFDACRDLTHLDREQLPLLIALQGQPGTGKTVTGTRLLGFFAHNHYAQAGKLAGVLWTSGYNLTHNVKYSSGDDYMRTWNRYTSPDYLLIDDVFAEKSTATDVHLVSEMIEDRKNHYRITIITTNKTPAEIEALSSRLSERLLEDAVIIAFTGPSRRLENMK
jgi:DNA replication protein DnaC